MARGSGAHDTQLDTLFKFGLGYPGTHVKSPWPGHRDLAVKDKTFVYLSPPGEPLAISCKLPASCSEALRLPFTSPTEYGLGKSGWVSASFEPGQEVPVDMLKAWIDESYRAQAPKRLSAGVPPLAEGGALESEVESVPVRKKAAQRPRRASAGGPGRGAKRAKKVRASASSKAARPGPGVKRAGAEQGTSKKNAARNVKAAKRPRQKATAAKRG